MQALVLLWNTKYPIDKWLRKKYNLRFNSKEHRETNLLDAYFEYLEDKAYKEAQQNYANSIEKDKKYKEQGWITEPEYVIDESVFDGIDYSLFDDKDDSTQEDNI